MLATQTAAKRSAFGSPSSRGATAWASDITLAPTEPFIGPSNAPSAIPETSGAEGRRPRRATLVRNKDSAIGSRLSVSPIRT